MIRTGYSFHHAFGHLLEVLSRLKEIGFKQAPICDHNSTFGFRRWRDLCKQEDMKPVYGVNLAVSPNPNAKKAIHSHWDFYAKDDIRSIHELVAKATTRNHAALTYREACEASGVFKIADHFTLLDEIRDGKDIFIGLSPATPKQAFEKAHELGYKFCATSCNVYPREYDKETYRVALGRRSNTQTYPQHILSDEEWFNSIWFAPEVERHCALVHRDFIMDRCRADLAKGEFIHPKEHPSLEELCMIGAARLGINLGDPAYLERMKREIDIIREKKFEDYFFIVADMIMFAKKVMIVGPGRGSSAGSLVCYLLGITNIDPIKHGTMFERFIDITRSDYPDIDSDFSDERREMVFDYMMDKYGSDHSARLGTVGMLQPKSALNQVGISLRIPKFETDKIAKVVPKRQAGDERAHMGIADALATEEGRKFLKAYPGAEVATRLEAHPANASQHAAGLLLTQNSILDVVAVDLRTRAAMLDMKDAVDFDLLKIDVLGLTQLSIFERCLELIDKPHTFLDSISLDDPDAYRMFREHKFSGISQWNGSALQGITKQIEVDCFNDLVIITSIARPGVTEADLWVKRRNGAEYELNPILADITRETLGIVVYQEQVLKIAREVGGLSWGDANKMRKTIAKTMGNEELAKFGEPFIAGAKSNGVSEDDAKDIWNKLCRMGSYAFNKSHAVAYSVISYHCAYLKSRYPIEFAAATLDAESDPMRQIAILRELHNEGVSYVAFDPYLSAERWTVSDGKLIGPLTNVKGIGPAAMQEILEYRKTGGELRPALQKAINDVATTPIDSLYPVTDAINRLCPDLAAFNIFSEPTKIIDILNHNGGEFLLIGLVVKITKKDMNDKASVEQRGYAYRGPSMTLNVYLRDDSGDILCKIGRDDMASLGVRFQELAAVDKSIFAIKGKLIVIKGSDFHMVNVTNIRYIGDMTGKPEGLEEPEDPRKTWKHPYIEKWWKNFDYIMKLYEKLGGTKFEPINQKTLQQYGQHCITPQKTKQMARWLIAGTIIHNTNWDKIRKIREKK